MQRSDGKSTSPSLLLCVESDKGFTLLEIILVLVIIGILAVAVLSRYFDLQARARQNVAYSFLAAAQSQLSLEYARRVTADIDPDTLAQPICDAVVTTNSGETIILVCTGNLSGSVALDAAVGGQHVTGNWSSPLISGS